MVFFGGLYLLTTTFILFFKKEKDDYDKDDDFNLFDSYKVVWKIASLKPIRKLIFILITIRVTLKKFEI